VLDGEVTFTKPGGGPTKVIFEKGKIKKGESAVIPKKDGT
jgi:hypothetical protein